MKPQWGLCGGWTREMSGRWSWGVFWWIRGVLVQGVFGGEESCVLGGWGAFGPLFTTAGGSPGFHRLSPLDTMVEGRGTNPSSPYHAWPYADPPSPAAIGPLPPHIHTSRWSGRPMGARLSPPTQTLDGPLHNRRLTDGGSLRLAQLHFI